MAETASSMGTAATGARCRFCEAELSFTMVDLGKSPLCQTMLSAAQLNEMEPFYPLHVYVCGECSLVQLEEYVSPESIFGHYVYFSSYSDSWLAHVSKYADDMTERFGLDESSQVVELASNDGYLLQYFVAKGIPVLGIEPAANVAAVAEEKGIPTLVEFFGQETAARLAAEGTQADLICGNNVLAQVPDLNSFVSGMKTLLAAGGVITIEFPHLFQLIEHNQFDTIYHEHFSYFSFTTAQRIFRAHGLELWDVEELGTHGGSLRIYGRHADDDSHPVSERAREMLDREQRLGVDDVATYASFGEKVEATKRKLMRFLIDARDAGKTVAGYGAPGKGNTLLNYCGIRSDLLEYTVDRSPAKHGSYLPGTHIPVFQPDRIMQTKPDYVVILPWNLKEEISRQMAGIGEWGGRFVVPIPEVTVFDPPHPEVTQ
ncbi:MAG TPA: class I SAM-dependent methyltransferase [Acidimicrobiia bacterium]|nr:class I SAM-dependent methyltransferase [Acidimicrobiia bacterium]